MTDDKSKAQAVWEKFCDDLRKAGTVLQREQTPADELIQAEGVRHLIRMVRAGLENTHEYANPEAPKLVPMVSRSLLYDGAGSDCIYLHAFIDGSKSYRISGSRGTAPLIEIALYDGKIGMHEQSLLLASLMEDKLQVNEDNSIEVTISPEPHPGNWMQSNARARYIMIRQYANNWPEPEAGELEIECLDAGEGQKPLTLASLQQDLSRMTDYLQHCPDHWASISDYWAGCAVNRVIAQTQADAKTDIAPPSGHQFSCGYFHLQADEALLIRFKPPVLPFWGLELANYWYEVIGFGREDSHLNNRTAVYDDDGTVRAVISGRRPANTTNWVDTMGHEQGTLFFRWSRCNEAIPEVHSELVKIGELEQSV